MAARPRHRHRNLNSGNVIGGPCEDVAGKHFAEELWGRVPYAGLGYIETPD